MRTAVIGIGEVGRCFAPALAPLSDGPLALCDRIPSPASKELAHRLNTSITSCVADAIAASDLIVSCVHGSSAPAVAEAVAAAGAPEKVLLDFATAPPQVKREAAGLVKSGGHHYVDGAIMGAVSIGGAATQLLAAGDRSAEAVERAENFFQSAGFRLQWLTDGMPGDAASLKLLRSVFTKGMEALAVECLVAAEHFGVRHALYDVLADVDAAPLPQYLEMLVTTHLLHSARRLTEIEQAEAQLRDAGLPVHLLPGARERSATTAETTAHLGMTNAPPIGDALQTLKATGAPTAPTVAIS